MFMEKEETELYKELTEMAQGEDARFYVAIFEKHLDHESPDIRAACIYGLLFSLKILDLKYRAKALAYLIDKNEDFNLRQWCISGLGQAYSGRKDIELISKFYEMLNDDTEDEDLKPALLRGLLILIGMSSRDIFLKTGVFSKVDEAIINKFSTELNIIENLIAGKTF